MGLIKWLEILVTSSISYLVLSASLEYSYTKKLGPIEKHLKFSSVLTQDKLGKIFRSKQKYNLLKPSSPLCIKISGIGLNWEFIETQIWKMFIRLYRGHLRSKKKHWSQGSVVPFYGEHMIHYTLFPISRISNPLEIGALIG